MVYVQRCWLFSRVDHVCRRIPYWANKRATGNWKDVDGLWSRFPWFAFLGSIIVSQKEGTRVMFWIWPPNRENFWMYCIVLAMLIAISDAILTIDNPELLFTKLNGLVALPVGLMLIAVVMVYTHWRKGRQQKSADRLAQEILDECKSESQIDGSLLRIREHIEEKKLEQLYNQMQKPAYVLPANDNDHGRVS